MAMPPPQKMQKTYHPISSSILLSPPIRSFCCVWSDGDFRTQGQSVTNTPGYGRGTSHSKEPFRLAGSTPSFKTAPHEGSVKKPFLSSNHGGGSFSPLRMSSSSQHHGQPPPPRNELMPHHDPRISPPSQQQQQRNGLLHPNERIPRNELLPYHNPGRVFADYDTQNNHTREIYNPVQGYNEMDYLHHSPAQSQQQQYQYHHTQQPQLNAYSQEYPSFQTTQRQVYSSQQMSPPYPSPRDNPPIAVIPQRGITPSSVSQYNKTSTGLQSSVGLPYARSSTSQFDRMSSGLQTSAGALYNKPPHVRPPKTGVRRAGTGMASGMVSASGGFGARPIGTPGKNGYPRRMRRVLKIGILLQRLLRGFSGEMGVDGGVDRVRGVVMGILLMD